MMQTRFMYIVKSMFALSVAVKVELRYVSKIVNSKSPEAKDYDFSAGDTFFVGNEMNIFRVNSDLKSYAYPIVKIIICCLLIHLWIESDRFIRVEGILDFVVRLIGVCFGVAIVYCISISIAEMIIVHDNRELLNDETEISTKNCVMLSINEVSFMVDSNDIIDIRIVANGKIVAIGASSDCKPGSSKFFDKLFFVGEKEFTELEDFEREIEHCSNGGQVAVISIDGIPTGGK